MTVMQKEEEDEEEMMMVGQLQNRVTQWKVALSHVATCLHCSGLPLYSAGLRMRCRGSGIR